LFKLALALGRTVNELEQTLGSGELTEWIAFYRIEPFGSHRDNYHAAIIAATVANYSGKLKTPKQVHEFMIEHPDQKRERETKHTLAMMDILAKNGK
jgi:hypothetical protein